MKTNPPLSKAAQSLPPATKAINSRTCEVTPFTVPVEWVELTFRIPATLAEYLDSQTPLIRSRYGRDIFSHAIAAQQIDRYQKSGKGSAEYTKAAIYRAYGLGPDVTHGSCQGKKTVPFTVRMEKWQWESSVLFACDYLKCSPAAFARAALSKRAAGIRTFLRNQAAEASQEKAANRSVVLSTGGPA